MSEAERAELHRLAEADGQDDLSKYVRKVLFGAP
jgi:hypothetical protein